MSDLEERFCKQCPRKLKKLPNSICPLAVMRLKHLRSLVEEPTEEEESSVVGCSWSIAHQLSGYCYFVYEAKFLPEQGLSDAEIASLLNISHFTVKETYDRALDKLKRASFVDELKSTMDGERVVEDRMDIDDDTIYCE